MDLGSRLKLIREHIRARHAQLSSPSPGCVLFFSVSDGQRKAKIFHIAGPDFETAWSKSVNQLPLLFKKNKLTANWLRVDWVRRVEMLDWPAFNKLLEAYRRNYFRYGFTLDKFFKTALLEQECNANLLFFGKEEDFYGSFQADRVNAYVKERFGKNIIFPLSDDAQVGIFSTTGVFCDTDGILYELPGVEDADNAPPQPAPKASCGPDAGLWAGRRRVPALTHDVLDYLIKGASGYLAEQMKEGGEFIYGYMPASGQRLISYNVVRHAGTILALLDTLEHTGNEALRPVIDSGIKALTTHLVRRYTLESGEELAYLVEPYGEIKIGGNGVGLVTLSRWTKFTGNPEHLPLMELLASGIANMQVEDGTFNHVLNASDLSLKDAHRTAYYDGEVLFGLMQLYGITKNERWASIAEKAFEAFIKTKKCNNHDHWLSYAANEMTVHRPEDHYFMFGLRNIANNLDFILERETTHPTSLELCMAGEKMIRRIEQMPDKRHLLDNIDLHKFRLASQRRAECQLNGYFWPEMAMYFRRPAQVVSSFFMRYDSFRVRIDDVAHSICGLVSYDALFARSGA